MRAFSGIFVVVLGWAASFAALPASAQQFEIPANAKAAIIAETNAYRQTKGLGPLRENASASEEAQGYANYLAETARQGHSAEPIPAPARKRRQILQVPRRELA